jgi:SAM-dependent methyltransferase
MKQEISRVIYRKLAAPYLRDGSAVLEIGCCDAKNFSYLSEGKSIKYYGVDLDDSSLKVAAGNNVPVIKADLEGNFLPFKSKFDMIIITEVLEHLKSPEELLKQIKLLLKGNGLVLISLPNEYNIFSRVRALFGLGIDDNALQTKDKHLHFPTILQSTNFIKAYFDIINVRYWSSSGGRLHFLLKYIPDSFFTFLANLIPGLLSRGVIFLCRKNDLK